ncbi:MAG: UDP-2,3-diacylglucosamine diphosphatase LpxI [Chitinispirillales bacterium]|jgi:DUF1009 family protein|nr:UDP-2,3-diacylglucosamine diphosphatase LpxI [Chitinispirillales bacterium]
MSNKKIGLIAGNKRLPFQFTDWAKRHGRDLYIIGIKGEVDEKLKNEVAADRYRDFYVCEISKSAKFLKQNGIDEIVMIGGVAAAKLKLNIDIIKIAFRLLFMKNKHKGVFTIILSMFEKGGVKVRAIQDFMTDLIIGEGSLGKIKPKEEDIAGFNKNLTKILDYIGTGSGQAVIIYKEEIIAYENFKGTDDTARRAAAKRAEMGAKSGGVMVKIMEPGQDSRVDLPVVGTKTIETIAKYGFDGVIVEAQRAITDNTADTIKLANEKGIFVYGVRI